MSVIENAIAWALGIANDPAHGYDQSSRWGPDYDCSSFAIQAFKEAGLPLTATYTGNMKYDFLRHGFVDASTLGVIELGMGAGLKRGDVLLHEQNHTAIYLGDGTMVQASINERGGITGGQTGDQTGREIAVSPYRNYPWDIVLRYVGENDNPSGLAATSPYTGEATGSQLPMLRQGDVGGAVLSMQLLLIHKWAISCGAAGSDGDFGSGTKLALETFQRGQGLEADAICGPMSWGKLIGGTRNADGS